MSLRPVYNNTTLQRMFGQKEFDLNRSRKLTKAALIAAPVFLAIAALGLAIALGGIHIPMSYSTDDGLALFGLGLTGTGGAFGMIIWQGNKQDANKELKTF